MLKVVGLAAGAAIAAIVLIGLVSVRKPSPSAVVRIDVETEIGGGHGSGVHLGRGIILTAYHVIAEGKAISVVTEAGHRVDAKVLWTSPEYDVAMIEAVSQPSTLGKASLSCRVNQIGDAVEGVGNPGPLKFVHVWGRVAGLPVKGLRAAVTQTVDITVAPGMSGGPIFNSSGQVVGLFDAMLISPQSPFSAFSFPITFMVPSSTICRITGRA